MPLFVEDPLSRIVRVHWKDDDDPGVPPDSFYPCGAFKHGYGLVPPIFGNNPGLSIFILDDFNIYGIGYDDDPISVTKPLNYWWSTADYLPRTEVIDRRDVPYIWGPGVNWTVTVDTATLAARYPTYFTGGIRIQEFRNLNIQRFTHEGPFPDRVVEATTMDIARQAAGEIFPPGFRVLMTVNDFPLPPPTGFWRTVLYPPTLVQAHCLHETPGEYPPLPPGYPPGNYWYKYPAPGSTEWPLRPPPPPPF